MNRGRETVSRVLLVVFCFAAFSGVAASAQTEKDSRMKWFREARFGMFIHWGIYSVPAGERGKSRGNDAWLLENTKMPVSEYEKYAQQFNPVKFDAGEWVRIAKDAGMKYIVITSKHHDGFGMFRSELTDWCIKSTPFQRDPIKELAAACEEASIRLCFYYSIMDWHHPDYIVRRPWNDLAKAEPDPERFDAFIKGQLKELLTNYGPIGILWFDGGWENTWLTWAYRSRVNLYNYVRGLQPGIIVNDRGVGGRDYSTPEQNIPANGFGPGADWESCMTMNSHWGYDKYDNDWKSPRTLVRNLIKCAGMGGNYLLNVGPTAEGMFPSQSVSRLKKIGEWMRVNGESIYATSAGPFRVLSFGCCTAKGSTLYLHIFNMPDDSALLLPGLRNTVKKAYMLADPGRTALAVTLDENGAVIKIPDPPPVALDPYATVIAVELAGAPRVDDTSE